MRMKFSLSVILAVMVFAGLALAQTAVTAGNSATPAAIRILAPNPGEKVTQSAVTVQFQLENPGVAASGFPNFSVQLDGRDPVITAQTTQDFTGLAPGQHTVVVQLVDANNTPVTGSRAETQFTVATPAPTQPAPADQQQAPGAQQPSGTERPPADQASAALPQKDDATLTDQGETLPAASSALPLLSVVGFGALVGGVISALRTR